MLLYYGSEYLISYSSYLAKKFNLPNILIGVTIIAINTKEDRETVFVRDYVLHGGNAIQAAIACGLSKATAKQSGYRMKNNLQSEIEAL